MPDTMVADVMRVYRYADGLSWADCLRVVESVHGVARQQALNVAIALAREEVDGAS